MKTVSWIALLFLLTQNPSQPGPPATIDGIVVRFGTSDPIARADVELRRISPVPASQGPLRVLPAGIGQAQLELLLLGNTINGQQVPDSTPISSTSPDGKFTFKNVPPGDYRVYVTRNSGYIPGEYGQRSPVGTGIPLTVGAGQNISNIRLFMTPTSSISGRILDGNGDPVAYARVNALRVSYQERERILLSMKAALTDDTGVYRIFSLPPGQYYVASRPFENRSTRTYGAATPNRFGAAQGADAPLVTLRTTETGAVVEETWKSIFYPSSPDARTAQAIALRVGEDLRGIDINLADSAVPARHVRGSVINGVTGMPAAGVTIRLLPRYQLTPSVIMPSATTDSAGRFDVTGVLSAPYSLLLTGSGGLTGYEVLDVGSSNIDGLNLVASPGVDIPWNATIEGGANDSAVLSRLRIALYRKPIVAAAPSGSMVTTAGWPGLPSVSESPLVAPSATGGYLLRNVPFGEYTVRINGLPPGSYIKSIVMGRSDVLKEGILVTGQPKNALEIVLVNGTGTLAGRVLDAKQDPTPNVRAVLVPDPSLRFRLDLFQDVASDNNGQFRFQGIAPGEYKLLAWEDVPPGAWHDPDFLRLYENLGTTIRISTGSNDPLNVKVIPWNVSQ